MKAKRTFGFIGAALLLQAAASAMLFPLASRLCAWLDRDVVKA